MLTLVREGLTNDQIARRLGISTDGAKFHVSEIITKLGVRKRGEAAEWQGEPRETARPSAMLRGRSPRLIRRGGGLTSRLRGSMGGCHARGPVHASRRMAVAC